MATVTGLTAERMLEIEGESIVGARVQGSDLILIKHNGEEINAGAIDGPTGPQGPQGPPGLSQIPGEVKLWPGETLPDPATYGKWVWADGAVYPVATYPLSAAHISAQWKTLGGLLGDPGAGNFRVPDLRGLVPVGMDAMPGGSRPSPPRMGRAVAIQIAKTTGEEQHKLLPAEVPKHSHTVSVNVSGSISGNTDTHAGHQHLRRVNYSPSYNASGSGNALTGLAAPPSGGNQSQLTDLAGAHSHGVGGSFSGSGSGGTSEVGADNPLHENVQPTVFVPYIVCLAG
jgi:microcystin-dependent protein